MHIFQVSVIIINYNSAIHSIECIKSIKDNVDPNLDYEIIIVDNNSATTDYDKLKAFVETQSNIKLIQSKLNLGFSGGHMLGVQNTSAEYLFFLNNDTVIINDCLSILYRFMKSQKEVGLCTGQMYNTSMSPHSSFNYFPSISLTIFGSGLLRKLKPHKYPHRNKNYEQPLQVDFVTGAAMFVDYTKFASIGGFDTNYFLYCEEEDIALRMNQNGYTVYIVPEAKFIHHSGKSTVRNLDIEKEYYISRLYYHRKFSNSIAYNVFKALYFVKNLRKFYKHKNYLKLARFIMCGAKMKFSMKHKQKLRVEEHNGRY